MDDELSSRMRAPSPEGNARPPQGPEFPNMDVFKNVLARGYVCSPKRLWYGCWINAVVSIIVLGLSIAENSDYHSSVEGDLGVSSGLLGFAAAVGGIVVIFLNKGGHPAYTNLLYYYFIIISLLSVSVPIAALVRVTGYYWGSPGIPIALLVFGIIQCAVTIFSTVQIKDNTGVRYFSFGGSNEYMDSSRMQNMARFSSRWNERDSGFLNFESPMRIKKNLRSEKCLVWTLTLYHLLCGLMLIGLGIFNLIENKPTAVAITFAPFWNGPVTILCSLIGFMALNRKTNGLGLTFLASNFLTFAVGVVFLVFVCMDIDHTIRCLHEQSYYCNEYINDHDVFLFSLTYSGFALFLLFQLIFSFVGIVLLFYITFSCCRRAERNSDLDAPPSYVESSSNFDPVRRF